MVGTATGRAGTLVVVGLMGVFGVWFLVSGKGSDQPWWYIIPFWIVWFSILLYGAHQQIAAPNEIIMHERGEIEFVSHLGRRTVMARDVVSVRLTLTQSGGSIRLEHSGGRILMLSSFDGFAEFVTDLRRLNPTIEFSGC